jgi:hypothetical protein
MVEIFQIWKKDSFAVEAVTLSIKELRYGEVVGHGRFLDTVSTFYHIHDDLKFE